MMDISEERIEGLSRSGLIQQLYSSFSLQKMCDDCHTEDCGLWLPRIDQHLAILKEKGWGSSMAYSLEQEHWFVLIYKSSPYRSQDYTMHSLEMALDKTVEWVLGQEEI